MYPLLLILLNLNKVLLHQILRANHEINYFTFTVDAGSKGTLLGILAEDVSAAATEDDVFCAATIFEAVAEDFTADFFTLGTPLQTKLSSTHDVFPLHVKQDLPAGHDPNGLLFVHEKHP